MEWFWNNFYKVEVIFIYFNVIKGGFIFGGFGGSGILIFREGNNWFNFVFYMMGFVIFGF